MAKRWLTASVAALVLMTVTAAVAGSWVWAVFTVVILAGYALLIAVAGKRGRPGG
jgi:hypothetical protein